MTIRYSKTTRTVPLDRPSFADLVTLKLPQFRAMGVAWGVRTPVAMKAKSGQGLVVTTARGYQRSCELATKVYSNDDFDYWTLDNPWWEDRDIEYDWDEEKGRPGAYT